MLLPDPWPHRTTDCLDLRGVGITSHGWALPRALLVLHPQALPKHLFAVSYTDIVGGSHRTQRVCYYFSGNKLICRSTWIPSAEKIAHVIKDCTMVHIYEKNKIKAGQTIFILLLHSLPAWHWCFNILSKQSLWMSFNYRFVRAKLRRVQI